MELSSLQCTSHPKPRCSRCFFPLDVSSFLCGNGLKHQEKTGIWLLPDDQEEFGTCLLSHFGKLSFCVKWSGIFLREIERGKRQWDKVEWQIETQKEVREGMLIFIVCSVWAFSLNGAFAWPPSTVWLVISNLLTRSLFRMKNIYHSHFYLQETWVISMHILSYIL